MMEEEARCRGPGRTEMLGLATIAELPLVCVNVARLARQVHLTHTVPQYSPGGSSLRCGRSSW